MLVRSWLIIGVSLFISLCLLSAVVPTSWGPVAERLGAARLVGVTEPVAFPLTAASAREFQHNIEKWVAERIGWPREIAVRLNNGVAYALGRSPNSGLELGQDRWIFGKSQGSEWCDRPPVFDVTHQAEKFVTLQMKLRERGKAFVLVISPSKRAIYSDLLLGNCRPPDRPRGYDLLKAALLAAGVALVDGHSVTASLRASQPWPVFGRDGVHWNDLPSLEVADAALELIGRQLQRPMPRVAAERIYVDDQPLYDENDLGRILNLPFELRPYPSPHAVMKVVAPTAPKPRIFIVGGSFSQPLMRVLERAQAIKSVDYAFYYSRLAEFAGGTMVNLGPSFGAPASTPRIVRDADAIVVEVNEETLDGDYVDKFLKDVEALD